MTTPRIPRFATFPSILAAFGQDANGGRFRGDECLTITPAAETIRNNEDANRLLTREYRRGFEVPNRVG